MPLPPPFGKWGSPGVVWGGGACQPQAAQAELLSLPSAFPPMPVPPAGFAGLTPEELRALEGHERQHLEARLQSLRNIHTLLDAAMLQINQYLTVLASLGYVYTRSQGGRRGCGAAKRRWWFSALLSCCPLTSVRSGILPVGTPKVSGFLVSFYPAPAQGLSGSTEEWGLLKS